MRKIFLILFRTILEAVFPLSEAEKELFSYTPEEAYERLPKAPPAPVADTRSVFAYKDERVSRLVWNIKYKRSEKAVKTGAYALFQALQRGEASPRKVILIPLPITTRRRHERGYNQCELLTEELIRLDSIHSERKKQFQLKAISDLLERIQHKSRQALKDRSARLADAKGIFSISQKALKRSLDSDPKLLDCQIIVIDDVITTGSTISEAMETLRKAGLKDVRGLSLAH